MEWGKFLLFLLLTGCAGIACAPDDFVPMTVRATNHDIFTYQKISNPASPVHIYIEGDGHAFNGRGVPTDNPTPRGDFVRRLAFQDDGANVVYMARPCQYVMSDSCNVSDWTDGRFSSAIIDSMASAIGFIAKSRPVVLIGYSGGAMIGGLVAEKYPELNITNWITIAGVLNHSDWTEYFGDRPLSKSMNLNTLPRINQTHYIATGDTVVPNHLSRKWVGSENLIVVHGASHASFPNLKLF